MPGPQVFIAPVTIRDGDIDVAVAQWRAAAPPDLQARFTGVVRRHEVEYLKPGLPADELVARTWVGEASGASWERFTEVVRVSDGRVLVTARTVWVPLDAATGRPRRVDPRMVASLVGPVDTTDTAPP